MRLCCARWFHILLRDEATGPVPLAQGKSDGDREKEKPKKPVIAEAEAEDPEAACGEQKLNFHRYRLIFTLLDINVTERDIGDCLADIQLEKSSKSLPDINERMSLTFDGFWKCLFKIIRRPHFDENTPEGQLMMVRMIDTSQKGSITANDLRGQLARFGIMLDNLDFLHLMMEDAYETLRKPLPVPKDASKLELSHEEFVTFALTLLKDLA